MSDLDPNSEANRGWVYPFTPASIGDRYHPEIVAVLTVDGTPSLQGLETTERPVDETLVDFVIVTAGTPELQTWRLDSGPATPLDTTEVTPFDYNATTNDKHWKFVGASGGGGGGGAWGSITGTLSDQTDLQSALNARQPLDSDLTAIAALTTNAFGRGGLTQSDAANFRSYLGVGTPTYTVNVKDPPYNATGDGVTDDTTAIQDAIDDVFAVGGGTIFFPKGIYLCNGAFDGTTNSILKIPMNAYTNAVISIALVGEMQAPWITNLSSSVPGGSIIKSTKTGTGTRPSILAGAAFIASPGVTNFNAVFLSVKGITFRTYDNPSIDALQLALVGRVSLEDVAVDTNTQNPSQPTHTTFGIYMPKTSNYAVNTCSRVAVQGFDVGLAVGEHFTSAYTVIAYCNKGFQIDGGNDQGATGHMCIVWCPVFVTFNGTSSVDLNLDLERAAGANWFTTTADIDCITGFNHGGGVIRYALSDSTGRISGPLNVTAPGNIQFVDLYNGNIEWNGDAGFKRDSSVGGGLWVTNGSTGWGTLQARVTARVTTITSNATPTINTDNCDAVTITALATAITSMTTNLSGTPKNFQKLMIRIKDDGTARAITWGASFVSSGATLPTTTVISKVTTVGLIWDSVKAKWVCIATDQEP